MHLKVARSKSMKLNLEWPQEDFWVGKIVKNLNHIFFVAVTKLGFKFETRSGWDFFLSQKFKTKL